MNFYPKTIAGYGIIAVFSLFPFFNLKCQGNAKMIEAPPIVEVTTIVQNDMPVYKEWIGTTDGLVNATIRAQVQGYLIKQNYKEGEFVKKGQILFEIDSRPFLASLQQAKAAHEQAKAELSRSEAIFASAQADLERIQPLAELQAVSRKASDDALGAQRSAEASVAAAKAALDAAQAALGRATLDLSFTRIVSPIDGIAGIAKTQVGDLVGPQQNGELTTVSIVDPIKVIYSVNEQFYITYIKKLFKADTSMKSGKTLEHELILSDGSIYPFKGAISVIDRQIDPGTGTMRFEAIFPNPHNMLRPGQFARVRIITDTLKGALLAPQKAIIELQGAYQIGVIGLNNRVELRTVQLGGTRGTFQVIEDGLKPGERIVSEGIQKIRQGAIVEPRLVTMAIDALSKSTSIAPLKPDPPKR